MPAQTISLRAAFTEAAKIGIPAARFSIELIQAARTHYVPAWAGYWKKARLDLSPGNTLADALRGTSMSTLSEDLQRREAELCRCGISRHWHYDQYHTLVFNEKQWLLYYTAESWANGRWDIFQSYWEMDTYIDESRWTIMFEDLANFTRFEASHIDFELRAMKEVWDTLGPALKAPLGRRPKYTWHKEQATRWARQNRYAEASAFRTFVQSLQPDNLIPKETMRKVFMPIWRDIVDSD